MPDLREEKQDSSQNKKSAGKSVEENLQKKNCRRKSIIAVDKEKVHCYNCLHEQRRSFYRKVTVESAPFFMLSEITP